MPALSPSIRHLLIDIDGVLYRGNTPLPDAARFIGWLRDRGIAFRLVTNNSTQTPEQYAEKLGRMEIPVQPGDIFTSALATASYLAKQGVAGQVALAIGEIGLLQALQAQGMRVGEDHPAWVVSGLDRGLTYQKLSSAVLAIRAGARFVGTNPDTSFPTERGLVPGAGAIQAAITACTGVHPIVIGKPEAFMFELGMESMGGTVDDTAMLGDRLDTDIAGAARAGLASILVLTGVSTEVDLAASSVRPDLVVPDLGTLMRTWAPAPAPVSRS